MFLFALIADRCSNSISISIRRRRNLIRKKNSIPEIESTDATPNQDHQMTVKRGNGGRNKHGRVHVELIRCSNDAKSCPKDKAVKRPIVPNKLQLGFTLIRIERTASPLSALDNCGMICQNPLKHHAQLDRRKLFALEITGSRIMSSITVLGRKLFSLKKKLRSSQTQNHYVLITSSTTTTTNEEFMVPKGYLPVYVGEEFKRYIIPLKYLLSSNLQRLLEQSVDGFDTKVEGPIILHCTTEAFEKVLTTCEG